MLREQQEYTTAALRLRSLFRFAHRILTTLTIHNQDHCELGSQMRSPNGWSRCGKQRFDFPTK